MDQVFLQIHFEILNKLNDFDMKLNKDAVWCFYLLEIWNAFKFNSQINQVFENSASVILLDRRWCTVENGRLYIRL